MNILKALKFLNSYVEFIFDIVSKNLLKCIVLFLFRGKYFKFNESEISIRFRCHLERIFQLNEGLELIGLRMKREKTVINTKAIFIL